MATSDPPTTTEDVPLSAVIEEAVALFYSTFDPTHELPRAALTIAAAPGRVNLIGDHTDYNDGFVMPLALDKYTVVVGVPADAHTTTSSVISSKFATDVVTFPADASLAPDSLPYSWARYVQGVTAMYLAHCQKSALPVRAAMSSSVPLGSGLSSSAAVEVAFATFLEAAFALPDVSTIDKALLCQRAEHEYCHVPCGIMDQFISAHGQKDTALLIDCRSHTATPITFQDPDVVILISNSNVKHELSGSEYSDRVAQCRAAVQVLQTKYPAITHLRDATMPQLVSMEDQLTDKTVLARARHVITENERATQCASLIQKRQYEAAGQLMFASHESLSLDYEVSTPHLQALVEMARQSPGVFGARMTGGGFGGCIVVLMKKEHAPELLATLAKGYPREVFGDAPPPTSFVTRIGDGAHVVQVGQS